MPEEEKKQEPSSEDRIAESIVRGLKPVLETVSQAVSSQPKSAPAPAQPSAPMLSRPSEEEVAEAMVDGNKQKVAELLRKQRAYDQAENRRDIGNLSTQGGAAISSIARTSAAGLPYYKRFKKPIDEMVEQFLAANPGAIATPEVYERAHDIVKGQHIDEIIAETREEAIRKAREPQAVLQPTDDAGNPLPREPESLAEVLVGDWKTELRRKNGRTGVRDDDAELRAIGFRGGLKEFLTTRKQMQTLEQETGESFGLDRDWVWEDDAKTKGHYVN